MHASNLTHRVKIRGIYSTALTKMLLDGGYTIVDPSSEIRQRFGLFDQIDQEETYDILILDRKEQQGVELLGEAEKIWQMLRFMREYLPDVTLMAFETSQDDENLYHSRIEFPGLSKENLDNLRSAVLPTLSNHHRFRIIDFKRLEKMEADLLKYPQIKEDLGKEAFTECILLPLQKTDHVVLEHVKPCGKSIRPRGGYLLSVSEHQFTMKRHFFSGGRYDGLNMPIEEGDYGVTEVQEGKWCIKHSYYSKSGKLKGEYYNINTPVELYPHGARYMDLEMDIVRRHGEKPFVIDRGKFAGLAKEGVIGYALEQKALEMTDELLRQLND